MIMLHRIFIFLIATLVCLSVIPFHLNPDNFIADDAYFYLQVAHHISLGHGSTFHQITNTNGYHPLWMLCCVVGAWLAKNDKLVLLHLMGIVQVIFFAISLYLLYKIAKQIQLQFFSVGLCILTFLLLNVGGLRLFEAHLAILLQFLALYLFLQLQEGKQETFFLLLFGTILGLTALARTDTIFFVLSLWLVASIYLGKRIFFVSLPAALLGFTYLGFNYSQFGHFIPISGVLKSSYPHSHLSWSSIGPHGLMALIPTVMALTVILVMHRKNRRMLSFYGTLLVGILAHASYIAAFSWGSQWYYTTAYVAAPLCFMQIGTDIYHFLERRKARTFSLLVSGCVLLVLSFSVLISFLKAHYHFSVVLVAKGAQRFDQEIANSPAKAVALLLQKHVEPDSGVLVFDSPGILAYYSDRKILPVDGLMNDFAYNEELVKKGVESYLQEKLVTYFLAPLINEKMTYQTDVLKLYPEKGKMRAEVLTPLTKISAGFLNLFQPNIVFITDNPVRPMDEVIPEVALWKINKIDKM